MQTGAILALALACIAPLFAGGVTAAGVLVVELSAFGAAIAAVLNGRETPSRAKPIAWLIFGIGAAGLIQWIPLPNGAVRAVSPASASVWSAAGAALAAEGASAPSFRLAIAPHEALDAALLAFAFGALVWAASTLTSAWVAEVFVFAGLVQVILRSFTVSNHDAAFLLMPLAVSIGIARTAAGPARRWSIIAAVVFAAAIIATGSRGAMVAAAAATAFLLLWNGRVIVFAAATALSSAAAILGTVMLDDPRGSLWQHSLEAWRRFPLLGSGLGSFADAFALSGAPVALGIVPHAHNGLLQIAVTGGATCAGLAIAVSAAIVLGGHARSALGLGAAGATLALAIHGMVDFSLSLPGILGAYLCLVGAALQSAQSSATDAA
jgi:hypothetical protein